jgi:hypothetical protein
VEKKRSLPPRWFLLAFLPPLFFFSFFLIRGNDIGRRVPILTPTIAHETCQIANPSLLVFDTNPYGVIEEGATGIAFFHSYGEFGECTMSFLNGSWHSHAHLSASNSSTKPIVIGLYGEQRQYPGKSVVSGAVVSSITKLQVVLPNGTKVPVATHDNLFYAWISNPSSRRSTTTPSLLGTNDLGNVVNSIHLSVKGSSNT